MEELVSIIVPVYNVKHYLTTCIDSLLNQTYRNVEVILVDDGSTDGSAKICDTYSEKDARIRVIHKINEGVAVARNTGIQRARGNYIQFVDSDDFLAEDMTETLMSAVKSGQVLPICNIKMVFDSKRYDYDLMTIDQNVNYSIQQYLSRIVLNYKTNPFIGSPCNKMFMKDIMINHKIKFQEGRSFAEDFIFNLDYLYYVSQVTIINRSLYSYRAETMDSLSKNIKSTEYWWVNYKQLYVIYQALFQHYGLVEEHKTKIDLFIELAVRDCIRKCFGGKYKLAFYEKVQKLKYVCEDQLTQEIMPRFEGNSADMKIIKFFSQYKSYELLGLVLVLYSFLVDINKRGQQMKNRFLDGYRKDQ